MTAPLIAPVIPSSARPSVRGRRAAGAGRRLPVAAVPMPLPAPQDVLYGFGPIDAPAGWLTAPSSGRWAGAAGTG